MFSNITHYTKLKWNVFWGHPVVLSIITFNHCFQHLITDIFFLSKHKLTKTMIVDAAAYRQSTGN